MIVLSNSKAVKCFEAIVLGVLIVDCYYYVLFVCFGWTSDVSGGELPDSPKVFKDLMVKKKHFIPSPN